MPVGTVAIITARPDTADELGELLADVVRATHEEAGCLLFSLQRSVNDSAVFVMVEKWESMAAFEQHGQSAHLAEFRAKSAGLLGGPPTIVVTEATNIGDPAKYTY